MLKNYELLYLVHPDLEGSTDKVSEKVAGFISKVDGEITNQEDWGKRKLAYPVAKNDFGVYILVNFTAESGKVPQVENNLKLSEEILRFMVVAIPEAKEPKPRKEKKEAKPKAEKPAEKEEVKAEVKKEKPAKEEPKEDKVEEKPKKAAAKKTVKKEEKPAKEEKPKKKVEKEGKAEEAERMKKLDEKLEQILGE
jgi:small subunit ribosomal protein S6